MINHIITPIFLLAVPMTIGSLLGSLLSYLMARHKYDRTTKNFEKIRFCGDFLNECTSVQESMLGACPYILYSMFDEVDKKSFKYTISYFDKPVMSLDNKINEVMYFKYGVSYYEITNEMIEFLLDNNFNQILSNVANFECIHHKNIDLSLLPCYNKLSVRLCMQELVT